jgi:hypothetical protein
MSGPNGYGPGSLSLLYLNLIDTFGYESGSTANGMPYGGGPKSGCRLVLLAFMVASQAALWESTGSLGLSRPLLNLAERDGRASYPQFTARRRVPT